MAPAKKAEPPKPKEITVATVQMDPRFPNQNQTKHCYISYVDFYRCQRLLGEGYAPCEYFKKVFTVMCPKEWVSKWDDQRAAGTFPGRI